jgi:NAD(P)-dependent dehydrogenase (short-subunit alcohol dehydrogenase family)
VLVGRDGAAGEAAAGDIRIATDNAAVEAVTADLASQASIRGLVAELLGRCPRLDVPVNNAGLVARSRTMTVDGIETVFALNHLAYFLLTNRLDFDDLQLTRGWRRVKAYSLSKLANVMFTYELARRLAGTGVTANCLHPGVIATKLLLDASPEVDGVTGAYFARRKPKKSTAYSYDTTAARRLWDGSARLTGL